MVAKLQSAARRVAEDYNAVFVPTQEEFNRLSRVREAAYWVWDGVHPTEPGHGVIARAWLKHTGLLNVECS